MTPWEVLATHTNGWCRVRYVFAEQDKAMEYAETLHWDGYSVTVQLC